MLLFERLKKYNLILASGSPRRRQLLFDAKVPFTVAESYPCDEIYDPQTPAALVAPLLSKLKSDSYPYPISGADIIITADTTVLVDDIVLGKPLNRTHAFDMLTALSGRENSVITGVTLRNSNTSYTFSVTTKVWFKQLSTEEIDYYIDNYNPYDKAGAYGIQEWIGYIGIERIHGSFYNVMGLPVQMVCTELEKFTTLT